MSPFQFAAVPRLPSSERRPWRFGAAALAGAMLVITATPVFAAIPDGFADLVAKVRPAVVNIATTQTVVERPNVAQPQMPPELRGSPFEEFFHRFTQPPGDGDSRARTALGSGFIIDPDGYVVTNNHVIKGTNKIQVTLADGRKFDARLLGQDEKTDVALLKIDTNAPLPYVSWGDSDKAQIGDWVLAVGNPFGLGGSVSVGIVSARGRDIQSGPFDDYLQIDASINRGNSGGPSFNRDGEVIGINTAIYSPNGGSIGIGFAIPSSLARPLVDELRKHGKIDRGWLGVQIQPVTKDIADSLGIDADKGALVSGITDMSPAAKAGVRQGDVILSVDGHRVEQFRDVVRLVAAAKPEKAVMLHVWRNGKDVTLSATLSTMPVEQIAAAVEDIGLNQTTAKTASVLGLGLAPVTRETRQRFSLPDDAKGAVIVDVTRDGLAAGAGLAPGDVILKAGEKIVAVPGDVVETVKAAGKTDRKAILLLVKRKGSELFVAVPLQKA